MESWDYYSGKDLVYPKFTPVVCECGKTKRSRGGVSNSKVKYCPECGGNLIDEFEKRSVLYDEQMKTHQRSSQERHRKFKDDLFEDFGVSKNTKRDACFHLAWERGHSCGYCEVYNAFSDLVELIE